MNLHGVVAAISELAEGELVAGGLGAHLGADEDVVRVANPRAGAAHRLARAEIAVLPLPGMVHDDEADPIGGSMPLEPEHELRAHLAVELGASDRGP